MVVYVARCGYKTTIYNRRAVMDYRKGLALTSGEKCFLLQVRDIFHPSPLKRGRGRHPNI